MRYVQIIFVLFVVCTGVGFGQQPSIKSEKEIFVVAPVESALLTIASQPDCPVQIEDAKFLTEVNSSRYKVLYELRNKSSKPISDVNVVALSTRGIDGSILHPWMETDDILMPGQITAGYKGKLPWQVLPLTNEIKRKLILNGNRQEVIVLIVQDVIFADGSKYSDEKSSEYLRNIFDEMSRERCY